MTRGSDERLSVGVLAKPTEEQIQRARRTVAAAALRAHPGNPAATHADCEHLLAVLGLDKDLSQ